MLLTAIQGSAPPAPPSISVYMPLALDTRTIDTQSRANIHTPHAGQLTAMADTETLEETLEETYISSRKLHLS